MAVQLDAEALKNGTVALVHARGIFPDGLVFHMPESDALPAPLNIADLFPPAQDAVTVMLAVAPPRKPNTATMTARDSQVRVLHYETTGRDEKPVQVGRKNISLRLDTEPMDDLVSLPIARVKRDGSGHYIFDPDFIPPCVEFSASERVMSMMARLIEILEDKSSRFARSGAGKSWAEFSTTEIANFWLLHTVNSALAPLRHHYLTRRGIPKPCM